jgi:ABC-type sugar transport system substrate-binding protein
VLVQQRPRDPRWGDLTVGYISPGLNTWRKAARMEAILQALTYPEVGRIISVKPGTTGSDRWVRSLSADGAGVIVGYNDFGPALAPAFQAAQEAGAVVSIFVGPSPETPATAIASQVTGDVCANGTEMAKIARASSVPRARSRSSTAPRQPPGRHVERVRRAGAAATSPDIKVVFKADTNWTLQGAFEAPPRCSHRARTSTSSCTTTPIR